MTGILKVDQLKDNAGADIFDASGNNITIGRSTGIVKIAKIPHLKVGASGALSMGGSNDYIRYNSFTSNNVFEGEDNMNAYSTADARYTIPAGCSGLWHISASLYTTTSNVNQLAIQVNGTRKDAIGSDNGTSPMNQGAMVKRLTAGDQIRILAFYASAVTTQGNPYHTWWEMTFLG